MRASTGYPPNIFDLDEENRLFEHIVSSLKYFIYLK